MNLVPFAKLEHSAWNKTAFLLPQGIHVLTTLNGNEMVDDTASEALLEKRERLVDVTKSSGFLVIFLWDSFFEEQN